MIEYMLLGAWLLTLIIVGLVATATGLPDDGDGAIFVWIVKILYLVALSVTMYNMGAHFGGM